MEAGAWPILVGGVICLLNCDNERDLILLNSGRNLACESWRRFEKCYFLEGLLGIATKGKIEAKSGL